MKKIVMSALKSNFARNTAALIGFGTAALLVSKNLFGSSNSSVGVNDGSIKKHESNSKQAFTGLANNYEQARPDYPRSLYKTLIDFWKLGAETKAHHPVIVDVGCGTGISSRAIHQEFDGNCTVYGIEPGDEMRERAKKSTKEKITYMNASAEAMPFEDSSVDIVTAAQAVQWFDRPKFYSETKRVLKDGGVLAIYENNRDWERSDFLERHEKILEAYATKKDGTKYSRYYREFPYDNELRNAFGNSVTHSFNWNREMKSAEFLIMAKSSTQVKRAIENVGKEKVESEIMQNINSHTNQDGQVDVPYVTKLYMSKKR